MIIPMCHIILYNTHLEFVPGEWFIICPKGRDGILHESQQPDSKDVTSTGEKREDKTFFLKPDHYDALTTRSYSTRYNTKLEN